MKKSLFLFLIIVLCLNRTWGRDVSILKIEYADSKPVIDGIFDEEIWKKLEPYSDFKQVEPSPNSDVSQESFVKIAYTNEALYIAAQLQDSSPDSILMGLGSRDNGTSDIADYFSVVINPYNDGINAYKFLVTAPGVQSDYKLTGTGSDSDWDAVWYSATSKNSNGWAVEMQIPLSALRFPKKEEQTWGIQFYRLLKRKNELSSWNTIDVLNQDYNSQLGVAEGIRNLKPPVRLSFTPYIGSFAEKYAEQNNYQTGISGGLDLKYGINESYTLDLTLIPDFSQVSSDDEELNLTPYEIEYNENRPFFTKGTEIFTKGNLFYSKRIGGTPRYNDNVEDTLVSNEIVSENESETELANAVKVWGRNKNGLALGVLNAITKESYARITDTITGNDRELRTQGITNYNLFVIDKNMKNNSYLNISNSNVNDLNFKYNANVTAFALRLNNKPNSYRFSASGALSKIQDKGESNTGFRYSTSLQKTKGNFLSALSHTLIDDNYDCNDLGYISTNNLITNKWSLNYNIYEPFSAFRKFNSSLIFVNKYLYNPFVYTAFEIDYTLSTKLREPGSMDLSLSGSIVPVKQHDYDEARTIDQYYASPRLLSIKGTISSDYRKKLAIDAYIETEKRDIANSLSLTYYVAPRLMPNDRLIFVPGFSLTTNSNDIGYVKKSSDDIIFGQRDVTTVENIIKLSYVFNPKSVLTMKLRHYWSKVDYKLLAILDTDGSINFSNSDLIDDPDSNNINYSKFNIDFVYNWYFMPGSEFSFVWKNSFETNQNVLSENYWNDLNNSISARHHNIFSIKFLYYINYQSLRGFFGKG